MATRLVEGRFNAKLNRRSVYNASSDCVYLFASLRGQGRRPVPPPCTQEHVCSGVLRTYPPRDLTVNVETKGSP